MGAPCETETHFSLVALAALQLSTVRETSNYSSSLIYFIPQVKIVH